MSPRRLEWIACFLTLLFGAVLLYAQNPVSIFQLGTATPVTTTLPVSGTVTAAQGTAANLNATIVGTGTFAVQNTQQGTASQNVAQIGATSVVASPCETAIPTQVAVSFASSSAQKVISKATSKKNYICSIVLVAGAAEIINVQEGTKTTNECDTSTAAVVGSTTAANGMSFAANGGFAAVGGKGVAISGIGTNVDTCLVTSGANRVSGWLTYVQE